MNGQFDLNSLVEAKLLANEMLEPHEIVAQALLARAGAHASNMPRFFSLSQQFRRRLRKSRP